MCVRQKTRSEVTVWDCLSDALEAAEILPCSQNYCDWVHIVCWDQCERTFCEVFDAHPRPTLAAELRQLYPRRLNGHVLANNPELWPRPTALNPPLQPTGYRP
jgi:hypothetical protein